MYIVVVVVVRGMESLTQIRFEVIIAMVSEDQKLYKLVKEFVMSNEKIKEVMRCYA